MNDFNEASSLVPSLDPNYSLDPKLSKLIEAAIKNNLKVLIYGPHGSGKSTHIEQICARLKLPSIRVNLDTNISRADLVGKDSIVMSEGKQVIAFKEGLLPYALKHGLVLILDEYDAARPETLFVLQKILEKNGKLFLFEDGREILPHTNFRIFATANTIGLGDDSGFYNGTQVINQSNLDRFDIVAKLGYLEYDAELELVSKYHEELAKTRHINTPILQLCVRLANLIRAAVSHGDLSVNFSTRTLFAFCKNLEIFSDPQLCFDISYANRLSDEDEALIARDLFVKCFGEG